MTARTRTVVRNVLLGAISLVFVPLHEAHPEWGYVPLTIWLVLMVLVYGVNLWFWAREAA